MTSRLTSQWLGDIADAAGDLLGIYDRLGREAFIASPASNRLMFRAIKNALAELGEACRCLPQDLCSRWPDVDWRGLAGLRNVVVHNYGALDTAVLVLIVTDEMPRILAAASAELARLPDRQA